MGICLADSLDNGSDLVLNMMGDHLYHFNKLSDALITISDASKIRLVLILYIPKLINGMLSI